MNLSSLFRRWRALTHKDELDQELEEEMRFHIDRETDQNIRNGMSPEDARLAALKSFSRVDQSKEECRDARGVNVVENIVRDVSYSSRVLLKNYAFTIVVVLTLALGIGATAAVYSAIDAALLRPLPFPHPHELVRLTDVHVPVDYTSLDRAGESDDTTSPRMVLRASRFDVTQLTAMRDVFAHSAVFANGSLNLGSGPEPLRIQVAFVTAGFEHSVANMYFVPLGFLLAWFGPEALVAGGAGAEAAAALSLGGFLRNLVAVTIGNMVGGGVLVGAVYWFIYLRRRPG